MDYLKLLKNRTSEKNASILFRHLKKCNDTEKYEYMGMLMDTNLDLKVVLDDIKNKRHEFDLCFFKELKTRQEIENIQATEPVDIVEGIHKCRKCGNKKILTNTAQLRSGDEGMNVFFTCIQCGNKWKT